jgi:hypothetical protein
MTGCGHGALCRDLLEQSLQRTEVSAAASTWLWAAGECLGAGHDPQTQRDIRHNDRGSTAGLVLR